jgi:hypothetical protein
MAVSKASIDRREPPYTAEPISYAKFASQLKQHKKQHRQNIQPTKTTGNSSVASMASQESEHCQPASVTSKYRTDIQRDIISNSQPA